MTRTAAVGEGGAIEGIATSPADARHRFRSGLAQPTTGWAPGYTQANLVVLPKEWAFDMLLFGQRNPQPVPLLDVTEPGAVSTVLAPGADLRTDLPRYRVWRDGLLVDEPTDVADLWADDLVSFLIGCSFSFETALLDAGVPVRNIEQDRNVSMYRTNIRVPTRWAAVRAVGGVDATGPGGTGRDRGAGDGSDARRARRSRARGRAGVARHRRSRTARLR